MNFDTFFAMNGMGIQSGLLAGPGITGATTPFGVQDEGFSDLLQLVESLEIADTESGVLDDVVGQGLDDISAQNNLGLQAGPLNAGTVLSADFSWNAGGHATTLSDATKGSMVADRPSLAQGPATMSELKNSLDTRGLELEGAKLLKEQSHASPEMSQRALESWSVPLIANEMRSLDVGPKSLNELERHIEFEKTKPVLTEEILGFSNRAKVSEGVPNKIANSIARDVGENVALKADVLSQKIEANGFQRMLVAQSDNVSSEGLRNLNSPLKDSLGESRPKGQSFSSASLSMMNGDGLSSWSRVADTSVVSMPESLMAPGDTRISSDAINFVSTQVDMLRAKGGGEMVVNLQPRNLGDVRIRVSRDDLGLKVELSAEKEGTLKIFQGSETELRSSLEKHGTRLEVVEQKLGSGQPLKRADTFVKESSSESFLQDRKTEMSQNLNSATRSTVSGAPVMNRVESHKIVGHGDSFRASFELRNEGVSSSTQSDASGDRRPSGEESNGRREAFETWEEQMEERKLA